MDADGSQDNRPLRACRFETPCQGPATASPERSTKHLKNMAN
jgi:hypothetical protein